MRRSARISARKGDSEDEGSICDIFEVRKTPSTVKKDRPKKQNTSTTKKRGRPPKIVETQTTNENGADSQDAAKSKSSTSKELFPVIEVDVVEDLSSLKHEEASSKLDPEEEVFTLKVICERASDQYQTLDDKKSGSEITKEHGLDTKNIPAKEESIREITSFQVFGEEKTHSTVSEKEIDPEVTTADVTSKLLDIKAPAINKKPVKNYNFILGQAKNNKNNLLKLTSDVFKKMSFKFTKEDFLDVKSNKDKMSNNDAPDMILLSSDGKKETDLKDPTSLASELDPQINSSDLYFDVSKLGPVELKCDKPKTKEDSIMKKSVLKPDLEKQESAPKINVSMTQKMKKRRKDNGETAGPGWFNLPKTEVTEELKKDLQVIKMRNILDPKRFYKKADKKMPKYFQIGTVIEGSTEFYSSRISKKDRKRTLVDELLEDSEFRRKNKKKYLEIQSKKESGGKKYYKKMTNKKKQTWAKS